MAIRICIDGEERQLFEVADRADPSTNWYVHWTGPDSVYEMRRFAGRDDNFSAARHSAELLAMNAPKGDVWIVNQPYFAPHRFGVFEPNPGPHQPEDLRGRDGPRAAPPG